jgi:hypothetical protein
MTTAGKNCAAFRLTICLHQQLSDIDHRNCQGELDIEGGQSPASACGKAVMILRFSPYAFDGRWLSPQKSPASPTLHKI